ncbi:MAG: hypothetical protein AAGA30_10130, partial [Planctomycetota bacterium]
DRHVYEFCRRIDRVQAFQKAILEITGREIRIECVAKIVEKKREAPKAPKMSRVQVIRQLEQNELVKSAIEVFDAEVVEFREHRKNK